MADLRIADAPEITESEVQGGLKIPTGGFGNKAINMNTVASWVVKDKDLADKTYVDNAVGGGGQGLNTHIENKNNPHGVTKEQVGLGNVDNTADADKPISNATSAALNSKADKTQLDAKADKTQLQGLATTIQLDLKADKTELDAKADKTTTYTKTEVDVVTESISRYTPLPYDAAKEYAVGERVTLVTGEIVQNTIAGNTTDPNADMTGWVDTEDAENAKHAVYVPNKGGSIGVVGGTFRGYSGGVQFVSDTAHATIGMTGISKADNYTIRIEHDFGAAKVGAMNLTPDESFAAMGVMAGASVAQDFSLAKIIAPLYFTCKGDGTITKVSPLFEGSVVLDAASRPANGILRFTHPLKSTAAHQAIACNRGFADNISKPMEINVFNNDGGTYTQINAYTEQVDSVWIKYNEETATFEAAQGINKASYGFSFNASTGLLSITHNTVKTGAYLTQPDIIPFQTANRYSINGVNANTTAILCYDPAGNIVKTPTTANFSFFFKIKPAVREMVLTEIPATNEFEVFVGNCYVPVDNLQKVPSGNIWFYGAMNK